MYLKMQKNITNKTFAVDKLKSRHDTYQKYIKWNQLMTDTSDTSEGLDCSQVAKDLIAVELEALERS